MNFDRYWASYKVILLRPKKSIETNLFQNKAFAPVEKKFLACLPVLLTLPIMADID